MAFDHGRAIARGLFITPAATTYLIVFEKRLLLLLHANVMYSCILKHLLFRSVIILFRTKSTPNSDVLRVANNNAATVQTEHIKAVVRVAKAQAHRLNTSKPI